MLLDAQPITSAEELALQTHLLACSRCRLDYQLSRAIRDLYRARFHYQSVPCEALERVQRTLEREYTSLSGSGQ